jgi:hypothetical protein
MTSQVHLRILLPLLIAISGFGMDKTEVYLLDTNAFAAEVKKAHHHYNAGTIQKYLNAKLSIYQGKFSSENLEWLFSELPVKNITHYFFSKKSLIEITNKLTPVVDFTRLTKLPNVIRSIACHLSTVPVMDKGDEYFDLLIIYYGEQKRFSVFKECQNEILRIKHDRDTTKVCELFMVTIITLGIAICADSFLPSLSQ